MGNKKSKSQPRPEKLAPRPPPKLLHDDPWRRFTSDIWTEHYYTELIDGMKDCFKGNKSVSTGNAVLLGPVGSGKSAFVNSVLSIGKNWVVASVDNSNTTKYGVYTHRNATFGNMKLFDTMGLEPVPGEGLNVNDITPLLEGHIPKDYHFNPRCPITPTDKYYIKNPKASDKTHCVMFCIQAPVAKDGSLPKETRKQIAELQEKIQEIGIPQLVLVTHVDQVCPEVSKDITKIYHSIAVEKAVHGAANIFKISPCNIHPVENYTRSPETDRLTNIPLLQTIRNMLDIAEDYTKFNVPQIFPDFCMME